MRPAVEAQVRAGHPWVFAESIREQNRPGEPGELAVIFDRKNAFLALGFFDPHSPIRVRIIHRGKPAAIDAAWWRERLRESAARRAGLFDARTKGGRWVNGESDGFPALVLDRYADVAVLKIYSSIWFSRIAELSAMIREELRPPTLVLRLSRNITERARKCGFQDGQVLFGPAPDGPVIFEETGLKFEADVLKGQKTGFFLDQRENRRRVEKLARGRRVLNAFSFSGGFSLYAARGGATRLTDVDISAHALESARRNFALNPGVSTRCEHQLIQANAFDWLRTARAAEYDLVVVDPPSLAKRQADRPAALKAYTSLAEAAFAVTRPGGVTVCCSCSAHIAVDEFFATAREAAECTRRKFQVLEQTREPADHHATFAEAEYLKAIYLQFEP